MRDAGVGIILMPRLSVLAGEDVDGLARREEVVGVEDVVEDIEDFGVQNNRFRDGELVAESRRQVKVEGFGDPGKDTVKAS